MARVIYTPARRLVILLMPLSFLLLASCSEEREYDAVPTYPVSGKVMADGKPAAGVYIRLTPVDAVDSPDALAAQGETASDGTFSLSTYKKGDGAPAGEYAVTLIWPSTPANRMKSSDPGPDRLRGKYADPGSAQWTVTIIEGENTLEPFIIE